MNYYERHLGDYARDTGHLSLLEHGVYNLLLDRYYSTEQGIAEDQAYRVARAKSKDERAAVDAVLAEFFRLEDGMWRNNRADEEIIKAQSKINAARSNGKNGGRPRKNPMGYEEKPNGFSLGLKTETQTKAHQTPDTKHQEKPKPNTPRFDARRYLVERGVSEQQADDWLTLRKAKRLPATITALEGVESESKRAGLEFTAAIAECCLRGWGGFKAEWLARDAMQKQSAAPSKHGDFSSKNYREGVNPDGSF